MTIVLPRLGRGAEYGIRHVRNSEPQRAGTGGSLTPLRRAGDHWAVEVDPKALGTACGRELLADIVRGDSERIRVPLPQPGVDVGPVGQPVVDGDDQAGSALALAGCTPHILIRKGWFLTVVTPDGPTAHLITETVVADEDGKATVSFWPMLWLQPTDGDHVELADPYLEGFVVDDGDELSGVMAVVRLSPFVIEEGE